MSDWQFPAPSPEPAAPPEPPSPTKVPFWGYADLAVFFLTTVASLFVAGLVMRLLFVAFSWSGRGKPPELLPAQFLAFAGAFVALGALLRLKYQQPFWRSLGWVRPAAGFRWQVTAGIVLAFAIALLGGLLGTTDADMPMREMLKDRLSILLVGIAATTVGPLSEELAFRGFLQPLLTRTFGALVGIFASALPFGLLHGAQYGWSWRHILLVTIAGSAFGWMRYRTGSTAAAAVMHAAYNTTLFLAFLLFGKDVPAKW
jgi:membrane protease YdiL (CAAX protease family)